MGGVFSMDLYFYVFNKEKKNVHEIMEECDSNHRYLLPILNHYARDMYFTTLEFYLINQLPFYYARIINYC